MERCSGSPIQRKGKGREGGVGESDRGHARARTTYLVVVSVSPNTTDEVDKISRRDNAWQDMMVESHGRRRTGATTGLNDHPDDVVLVEVIIVEDSSMLMPM